MLIYHSRISKINVSNFYPFSPLRVILPTPHNPATETLLPIMYQRLLFQHRLLRLPHLIHNRFHFCHILFINIPSAVNSLRNLIQNPTDFSKRFIVWTNSTEQIHDRYSDEEIKTLWSKLYEINNVDIILIMIYTGLRPTELLEIQTKNVHLDEKYMVGGMKTEAGKDRIIPLNDKIIPLVKNRYDPNKKYLINNKFGNHYTYGTYMNGNFNTCMGKLKMKHLPHDGRHTFASLMDSAGANDVCIKLIMGHSMKNDTTKGTYTHKTLEELLAEVNKI